MEEQTQKPKYVVTANVIAHAFDSRNAIQYFPGDVVELDLSNRDQRKLVWLKTPRSKWIFQFDRAGASDPSVRMFFCKECGQPFESLNEVGTHTNEQHNKVKAIVNQAKTEADAETEARLLEAAMNPDKPVAEEAPIVVEKRGKKKAKLFGCKICKSNGIDHTEPNPYAMRMHYKIHEKSNVPPPVAQTAGMTQQA